MANIKKQYEEIYEILEANQNRKVSSIMDLLMPLMLSKGSGSDIGKTFLKDAEGDTYAVFCYYHKKWELTKVAEYGSKANTATGMNTMCKEGANQWSKQQRAYKKTQNDLLTLVAANQMSVEDMQVELAAAEEARKRIEPRSDEHGFDTAEELAQ